MLTNPYVLALGIPVILIVAGALAKKLVRGSAWRASDFFLGVELSLAAMASGLVYVSDLARVIRTPSEYSAPISNKMVATASFLALCFFLLLWVLSTHQDWEKRTQNPGGQIVWLGLITNLIGVGLLTAFVLYVKGI